jgi:hypothetical protein
VARWWSDGVRMVADGGQMAGQSITHQELAERRIIVQFGLELKKRNSGCYAFCTL